MYATWIPYLAFYFNLPSLTLPMVKPYAPTKKVSKAPKAAAKRRAPKAPRSPAQAGITTIGSSFRTEPMSASYGHVISQPTWLHMEGKVSHPEFGGGVRIAGRQLLCSVTTTAGDSKLFLAMERH